MANSNRVTIDNLSKAIFKTLTEGVDDIETEVAETSTETIKEAKKELEIASPKNEGEYSKSWTTKKGESSNNKYSNILYNKKHYRRTHLLEFGHVNRDGTSRTKPQPHIRPIEDKYKKIFAERLKQRIGGKQ